MAMAMAGPPRNAVRCSTCGADMDLARMGEHVCSNGPALHMPKPNSPAIPDRFQSPSPSMSSLRNQQVPALGKLPKFAPPARIDPFIANDAFLPPPQTAPGMHSDGMPGSPARSGSPASSRFRMPPRSATTPHFSRGRSPSPEMRISQDSAFPLFPTKKVREDRAKKERQRSKSVSRSQSRDRGAFRGANDSASRSASPAMPPFPQRPSTAGGSASRKNSISSVRSKGEQPPFDSPSEPVPPLPAAHEGSGRASPRFERQGSPPGETPNQGISPLAGPPWTPAFDRDNESPHSPMTSQRRPSEHFRPPTTAAAIKPLDAIGSARRSNFDMGLNIPRSQSASGQRNDLQFSGPPAIPEPHSALVDKGRPEWDDGPAIPEALTIRSPASATGEGRPEPYGADEDRLGNLPSFKPANHGPHTTMAPPRTSTSSDGSAYSATHSISSRSSPPTSASSFMVQDNLHQAGGADLPPSETGLPYKPPADAQPTLPILGPPPAPTAAVGPASVSTSLEQRRRGPAKSFSRPNYTRPQLDISSGPPPVAISPPQPSPRFGQNGSSGPPSGPPTAPRDPRPPLADLRLQAIQSPASPNDRPFSPMTPRTPQTPGGPGPIRRPTTPGFKGNCRGCGEAIVGKSVSSADGRLTGRYHKQCFVCQTCKEPFQTADFYVINNQPYCQRHYHTLNGSMCNNCDRGIEGPYMETDASKKFHPHCFTCKECHLILRNDYYEVDGVIYCEKHSRKPDLLGPGRRFPERRTTRLMMM